MKVPVWHKEIILMSSNIQKQIKKESLKVGLLAGLLVLVVGAVIAFSREDIGLGIFVIIAGWAHGYVFGSTQSKIKQLKKQL